MDFCQLLHTAQKNDKNTGSGARYYSTKFEPPKKVKKETKDLSANIKKFLAKKEAEEQKQRDHDHKKRDDLLALRAQDKKATRRVNVMLKRTKSANQSVIEDATDNTHTAVTRAGPDQPDEDDYGYVSTEASQYYDKMMEKYSKMPDEPKFNMFKKKVSTNLSSTKDRVKAALEKEREEAMAPHRRKRKKKEQEGEDKQDDKEEETSVERKDSLKDSKEKDPPPKPKPKFKAPPPMSFTELLKIAEKKQFEPIIIEQKPQDDEKPLTKKQKREAEKEREWRAHREARRMNGSPDRVGPEDNDPELRNIDRDERRDNDKVKYRDNNSKSANGPSSSYKIASKQASNNGRENGDSRILERQLTKPNSSSSDKARDKDRGIASKQTKPSTSGSSLQRPGADSFKKPHPSTGSPVKPTRVGKSEEFRPSKSRESSSNPNNRPSMSNVNPKSSIPNKVSEQRSALSSKTTLSGGKNVPSGGPRDINIKKDGMGIKKGAPQMNREKYSGMGKGVPSRELGKPKEFPPRDLKPKQFPPPDVRGIKRKPPMVANKGRIIDDDSEEEYDSELDDFIDDDPEEDEGNGYSSVIKEIFGYDKSRYRGMDDDDDNMETPYAQQMKEEVISSKLGLKEDLEDMKMEEEEKRRKALRMKKMKR